MKAIKFSRSNALLIDALEAGEQICQREANKLGDELTKHLKTIQKEMFVDNSDARRAWVLQSQVITGQVIDILERRYWQWIGVAA